MPNSPRLRATEEIFSLAKVRRLSRYNDCSGMNAKFRILVRSVVRRRRWIYALTGVVSAILTAVSSVASTAMAAGIATDVESTTSGIRTRVQETMTPRVMRPASRLNTSIATVADTSVRPIATTSPPVWTSPIKQRRQPCERSRLENDVPDWITVWRNPNPFRWNKTADEIGDSPAKYMARISGAAHYPNVLWTCSTTFLAVSTQPLCPVVAHS